MLTQYPVMIFGFAFSGVIFCLLLCFYVVVVYVFIVVVVLCLYVLFGCFLCFVDLLWF